MPCRSYESDWASNSNDAEVKRLKALSDKLARIACKALTELEKNEVEDFLLLQDDEVREWWQKHKEDDAKAAAKAAEKKRREEIKKAALSKLSEEELMVLGINATNSKKGA